MVEQARCDAGLALMRFVFAACLAEAPDSGHGRSPHNDGGAAIRARSHAVYPYWLTPRKVSLPLGHPPPPPPQRDNSSVRSDTGIVLLAYGGLGLRYAGTLAVGLWNPSFSRAVVAGEKDRGTQGREKNLEHVPWD